MKSTFNPVKEYDVVVPRMYEFQVITISIHIDKHLKADVILTIISYVRCL